MKLNHENAVLVVWPATIVGADNASDFNTFLANEFNVIGAYEGEFKTLPDEQAGEEVEGTGGRNDALFWVDATDISKFAVPRLAYGMRWWSDYINNSREIVPDDIVEKYRDAA